MPANFTRRHFLKATAATAVGTLVAPLALATAAKSAPEFTMANVQEMWDEIFRSANMNVGIMEYRRHQVDFIVATYEIPANRIRTPAC